MRKFTKEHNELEWLFPFANNAEKMFEDVEQTGEYLFDYCYDGQESFDKDDMIDAFMKGYSNCQQMMTCHPSVGHTNMLNAKVDLLERQIDKRDKIIDSLMNKIKELENKISETEKN